MSLSQYREQLRKHNFIHSTNRTILRSKYKISPDPSCPECNPVSATFGYSSAFSKFWPWFQIKYKAQSFTCNTIALFADLQKLNLTDSKDNHIY
jgi:hypothetical protein